MNAFETAPSSVETSTLSRFIVTGGIMAGPIYILLGLAQIMAREGFDVTRHPLSMLSLGDFGWIQITNFIMTGFLVFVAAITLRRFAQGDRRLRRGAFLIGLYGFCVLSAGIFATDPSLGFPPGTPNDYPKTISWHGWIHFIVGQLAFLSLIVATFVYGKYFAVNQMRPWAVLSRLTGVTFLTAIIAMMVAAGMQSATGMAGAMIFLYVTVALGWVWLSALIMRMRTKA